MAEAEKPELEDSQWWPQNFQRNQAFLKEGAPTSYNTALQPDQETAFRQWVGANQVPFNPALPVSDYDMRGFWLAKQAGDQRAVEQVDPNDIDPQTGQARIHRPDYWKTPYSATFSAESQWANPQVAPRWQGDLYQLPNGQVLWNDQAQQWVGPNAPWAAQQPSNLMQMLLQRLQGGATHPVIELLNRLRQQGAPGPQSMAVPPHLPQGQEVPDIIAPAPREQQEGDYPHGDEYGHIPKQGPALTPVTPPTGQGQASISPQLLALLRGGVA